MSEVVSLGSVNVDHVRYRSADRFRDLETDHDWFPRAGETVRIADRPTGIVEDVVDASDDETAVGGKGANQAVAAARASATTAFLGCVGSDGDGVRDALSARGVDVDGVAVTDGPTGAAYVYVDDAGESWIAIVGGANDAVDEAYVDRRYDRVRSADVLLLQNEIPVATMDHLLVRLADDDPATRPTVVVNAAPAAGAEPLLERRAVDVVVVNDAEYRALADHLGAVDGTVVRTQGANDVVVTGEVETRVTPPSVDPVDTTGAGDAFCGSLAATLADGTALDRAIEIATVAGSLATEREGVQPAIPSLDAVRDALEDRSG